MQTKEMKVKDLPVWPPIWSCKSLGVSDGVLKHVEIISGTGCVKIDVEHADRTHVGVILTGGDNLETLFHRLKENIGRPLAEIENLEVKFYRGAGSRDPHKR